MLGDARGIWETRKAIEVWSEHWNVHVDDSGECGGQFHLDSTSWLDCLGGCDAWTARRVECNESRPAEGDLEGVKDARQWAVFPLRDFRFEEVLGAALGLPRVARSESTVLEEFLAVIVSEPIEVIVFHSVARMWPIERWRAGRTEDAEP